MWISREMTVRLIILSIRFRFLRRSGVFSNIKITSYECKRIPERADVKERGAKTLSCRHGRRPTPKSGGDQIGKLLVRKT